MPYDEELDDLFEDRDVVSVTELADTLDVSPYIVRGVAKQTGVARLGPLLAINRDDSEQIVEELISIGALLDEDPDDEDDEPDESDDDPDVDDGI